MTRTFRHKIDPPHSSPVAGPDVQLTVQEIEDAGVLEILQTPGVAFGSWAVLDALLQPGISFVFREPLGQAREVKVALSGLFGRFVARAYLQRYFGLSIFAHLGRQTITLDGRRQIKIVKRVPRGDLPDWVVCSPSLSDLTVVEAKGCHHPSNPARVLDRAWSQAERIDIEAGGHRVPLKRLAIVTRWGVATNGPRETLLSVRDPIDEGDPIEPDDKDMVFAGLFRHHVANIISPLGHVELAGLLRDLARAGDERSERKMDLPAHGLPSAAPVEDVSQRPDGPQIDDLIGGFVTRAGPLTDADVSRVDRETLARLDLRPVFVGVERELVRAAIEGDPASIRKALSDRPAAKGAARSDRAGCWIIPFRDGAGIYS